ncbi:MAG: hypothetical protein OEY20_07755 [Gemmatimonadota bacterium]|nr:hypothetical protein [Gemmatimonadota bacterium]
MTSLSSNGTGGNGPAPFSIHSVHFCHPHARDAIVMRDPEDDALIGATPEWDRRGRDPAGRVRVAPAGRNAPAAYPAGTQPDIEVVFARVAGPEGDAAAGEWAVGATSATDAPAVAEARVTLAFDAQGLSAPVTLRLDRPLMGRIGVSSPRWTWHARRADGVMAVGTSEHTIYTTWRRPLDAAPWARPVYGTYPNPSPDAGVANWTYAKLVAWTCEWAAGADNPKAICDAIIANTHKSTLQYYVFAWDVRTMLLQGGGLCGGWYKMFQGMAAAHGVAVERRSYSVDWRTLDDQAALWCAIVVREPGLNRTAPVEQASRFHDADHGADGTVREVTEPRYRFWGAPGSIHDGHCVNLLQHDGEWYVYDVSFFKHAVALRDFTLPPPDQQRRLGTSGLGNFRTAYLNEAVAYMLGSLRVRGTLYQSRHCSDPGSGPHHTPCVTENGLTVRTATVPDDGPGITFFWGP